ncbi:hypothetical protein TNCV_4146221 [Trichonephila clavipes]|nr:hypothetical protein TNCV_4146221 [Trichonephila clavipes]
MRVCLSCGPNGFSGSDVPSFVKINKFSESSPWEVKDICSIDSKVAVKLFKKGNEEVSKDIDRNYYMMSLRTSQS